MSVLVRMDMPKEGCHTCDARCVSALYGYICGIERKNVMPFLGKKNRPDWCPIICPIPDGHGDLVDWNDVEKELEATFADYVDDVPYFDNGQPGFLRRKVYPDAIMIRPIKAKIIIPEEGGK